MSRADLHERLGRASEITLSVKGRKSGRDIPRLVWFVHEGNVVYLLPVQGAGTNWYKNFLTDQTLKISADSAETSVKVKPITDSGSVENVVRQFRSKYGEGDVKRYYPKPDVAVAVTI